jgi:methionyl-tRNA formyltransferase
MDNNRVVVCAYHNVGYRCLEELIRQGAEIALVFTHEDSKAEEIWFSSVRDLAEMHDIPWRTTNINAPESIALLRKIAPDFIFSFYYRNMIKKEVLDIPLRGALNMHGSLLPRYRGRVPVNWAIINGETESGATLHYMVEKPDAGDIVDQEKVPLLFTDTALDLFNRVTGAALKVMVRSWPLLLAGTAPRKPMDLTAGSYFGGRKAADGLIDWTRGAVQIYNLVRGVTHPYPGAFTYLDGRKVTVWQAWPVEGKGEAGGVVSVAPLLVGTGEGLLEIRSLQFEWEEELTAIECLSKNKLNALTFCNS